MAIIAPSILSSDFSKLGAEIERTAKTKAEYIHIDVMDGNFVPNLTIGPCVISSLRHITDKVFDVHLMIDEPIRYVGDFVKAGADVVTVHLEACSDVSATLRAIRSLGAKAGLSVKPGTSAEELKPYLPLIDMILIMTVEPGFGGQSFIPEAVENVKIAKRLTARLKRKIPIEVDGGITVGTIGIAAKAGASIFVAGSAVYGKPDIGRAVEELLAAAEAQEKKQKARQKKKNA